MESVRNGQEPVLYALDDVMPDVSEMH